MGEAFMALIRARLRLDCYADGCELKIRLFDVAPDQEAKLITQQSILLVVGPGPLPPPPPSVTINMHVKP